MDESDGIETPKIGNTKDEPTVELNDLIDQKDDIEKRLVETNDDDVIDEDDADLFSLIDSMYEENNE